MRTALRPRAQFFVLAVLAIVVTVLSVAVRWNHITALPFEFHAARQYHSAQPARSYYVIKSDSAPAWKKRVAHTRLKEDPPLEPPIFEYATATAYRVTGGAHLWMPRIASSLFWIAGGVFLYLLAPRFAASLGALLAVGVYLFFPFPLVASTSFQPDPLMVMLILATLPAILRHHEHPTRQRFVGALALSGAAVLVKPGSAAFFVLPVFATLAIVREGTRGALTRPSSYTFPHWASFRPRGCTCTARSLGSS